MKKYIKISILLFSMLAIFVYLEQKRTRDDELLAFKENNQEEKVIALTFDDGPHYKYTPYLLDELNKRNVKATFFVLGMNANNNLEILKRMNEEGHVIGNHTYSHKNLYRLKSQKIFEEIDKTNQVIEMMTHKPVQYFRPSYGNFNNKIAKLTDMQIVLWNIDSLDWKIKNSNKIANRVINKAHDGAIILMHDIYKSSVKAALKIIDKLQEEGYKFVTVDELLNQNS